MLLQLGTQDIFIQDSSWDDYPYCYRLTRRHLLALCQKHGLTWQPRNFRKNFYPEQTKVLLTRNRRIGYYSLSHKKSTWVLEQIYISPTFQRKGLGTKLISQLEKGIIQEKGSYLSLRVFCSSKAVHFYQHLDYSIIKKDKCFYVMRKYFNQV